MEIGIIILAAGSSSRMGQSKQLLAIDGESLLVRSVKIAIQADVSVVMTVLGSNAEEHKEVIHHFPVEIVLNEEWKNGIGSSIKAGLNKLLSLNQPTSAVILMVCDQPLLSANHLNSLISEFKKTKKSIVASFYSRDVGSPVLFERSEFEKLLSIDNSTGAQKLIKENKNIALVSFEHGAIDLDTIEDYRKFLIASKGGL